MCWHPFVSFRCLDLALRKKVDSDSAVEGNARRTWWWWCVSSPILRHIRLRFRTYYASTKD